MPLAILEWIEESSHLYAYFHVIQLCSISLTVTKSWFMVSQITQNEARVGVMRLIVGGGRATEDSESKGSVIVGVRTLSEGGCVGNFSREQVYSAYGVYYHYMINLFK